MLPIPGSRPFATKRLALRGGTAGHHVKIHHMYDRSRSAGRFVAVACLNLSVCFDQARMAGRYRFTVVGHEWQTDIGRKAVMAYIHPIAARRGKLGVDPRALKLSLRSRDLLGCASLIAQLGDRSRDPLVQSMVGYVLFGLRHLQSVELCELRSRRVV